MKWAGDQVCMCLSGEGGGSLRSLLSEHLCCVCVCASEQKATEEMEEAGPVAGWAVREARLAGRSVKTE